jgi:diguanylate cyclase (GGDEF)-like protein
LLESLSGHAAIAIANAQLIAETSHIATTDPLTGLPNHRHLMERLDAELARAKRHDHPLAVMMIDVDNFKLVNDAHGHTVGDDLIRLIGRVLRDELRASDVVGRYGGDEFLALLPETAGDEAARASERLVDAIRRQ